MPSSKIGARNKGWIIPPASAIVAVGVQTGVQAIFEKTNRRPVFRIVTGWPVPPVTRPRANGSTGDLDGEPEVRKYNRSNPRHAAEQIRGVNLVSASCSHWITLYACPCCERQVRTAALPPQPIPQSIASPGLLAYVATAKYVDALPLYRQEVMFQRLGADLPRATFANWMIQCGQLIQPLINLMRDQLLAGPLIQMDEIRVQVLKEPEDRPAQSPSWMWVSRGGPPGHPLILYDYHASRGMAAPLALLEGYQGVLQTDGYRVYRQFGDREGMVHR